jgi:hypothetical protein
MSLHGVVYRPSSEFQELDVVLERVSSSRERTRLRRGTNRRYRLVDGAQDSALLCVQGYALTQPR